LATPIIGSFFTKTARIADPFATFKFHVEIGKITDAAFTECNGMEMSTQVKTYEEGGENQFVHKFPGRTTVSNVTLKHGFTTSNDLYNWYKRMEECLRLGRKFDFQQVTITLYSTVERYKKARWILDKAFPVKWTGPSFKSDEAAVAVESLELAHHGIMVDELSDLEKLQQLGSSIIAKLF
jgi:phage tail-like protein